MTLTILGAMLIGVGTGILFGAVMSAGIVAGLELARKRGWL